MPINLSAGSFVCGQTHASTSSPKQQQQQHKPFPARVPLFASLGGNTYETSAARAIFTPVAGALLLAEARGGYELKHTTKFWNSPPQSRILTSTLRGLRTPLSSRGPQGTLMLQVSTPGSFLVLFQFPHSVFGPFLGRTSLLPSMLAGPTLAWSCPLGPLGLDTLGISSFWSWRKFLPVSRQDLNFNMGFSRRPSPTLGAPPARFFLPCGISSVHLASST